LRSVSNLSWYEIRYSSWLLGSPAIALPGDDGPVTAAQESVNRTEYYRTELEAMKRARQLLEDGGHHGIPVQ
jgi:predicted transcriptional regulator